MKDRIYTYRVRLDGVTEELDLLDIVQENVHEGVEMQQGGTVDVAATTHVNPSNDLVTGLQTHPGQLDVNLLVGYGNAGMGDVIGFSQLHQINRVVILHVKDDM